MAETAVFLFSFSRFTGKTRRTMRLLLYYFSFVNVSESFYRRFDAVEFFSQDVFVMHCYGFIQIDHHSCAVSMKFASDASFLGFELSGIELLIRVKTKRFFLHVWFQSGCTNLH